MGGKQGDDGPLRHLRQPHVNTAWRAFPLSVAVLRPRGKLITLSSLLGLGLCTWPPNGEVDFK
eukprot:11368370-Prorocentrum_lima.AAC.1